MRIAELRNRIEAEVDELRLNRQLMRREVADMRSWTQECMKRGGLHVEGVGQ